MQAGSGSNLCKREITALLIAQLQSLAHHLHVGVTDLFSFLRFTLQPVDASESVPLRSRRWNFSLFAGLTALHAVDATPAEDKDVSHLSSAIFAASRIHLQTCGSDSLNEAEVTAAMHNVKGNAVHHESLKNLEHIYVGRATPVN